MTVPGPAKVGWCPGALRPMETGDGLVVRVKPRGGVLPLDTAEALASLALRLGNGDLDLTARANLQIRGVRENTLERLLSGLHDLGLLDQNAESEAVRNVVGSPLAGLEHGACLDIRPVAAAIEARLASDETLWRLPAKWSILLDDGGPPSLAGVPADLRFEATGDGSVRIGLADAPLRARCAPEDVPDLVAALARSALGGEPRRMGALVRERGAGAVFSAAGLAPEPTPATPLHPVAPHDLIGWHRLGNAEVLGVAAAFGSCRAEDLLALLEAARAAGAIDLRLTPWRVLLLTGLTDVGASHILQVTRTLPLIADPDDRRLAITACSGMPACARATTPVRADAAALAGIGLPLSAMHGPLVHVSGCAKGCAHAMPVPWTLVGRSGRYDLVRDGKAGDAPIAMGLTFQEAAGRLSRVLHAGSP